MIEINERQYLFNLGEVPMIIWERGPFATSLLYINNSNNITVLAKSEFKYRIDRWRGSFRRFFTLTDEEVECMVLPRII